MTEVIMMTDGVTDSAMEPRGAVPPNASGSSPARAAGVPTRSITTANFGSSIR
jgi:hypothetical protein